MIPTHQEKKPYLRKMYLVRSIDELVDIEEKTNNSFNRVYKIIGEGRMITERAEKDRVIMYPQNPHSNIEKIVLRRDKSQVVVQDSLKNRNYFAGLRIGQTEYLVSNGHFPYPKPSFPLFLVRNRSELSTLMESLKEFEMEYEIIPVDNVIAEMGINGGFNLFPKNKSSMVIIRSKKDKELYHPREMQVEHFNINNMDYYISNNPDHYSR